MLYFIVVLFIVGANLKNCSEKESNNSNLSITSLFKNEAYKMYWNNNMLIIEMPYPTIGVVGINKVSWGKVDVDDLLDDIYENVKSSNYPNCLVCARFISTDKDKYGNKIEEKSELHLLVSINPTEARKYQSGEYLNDNYHITKRILSEALCINYR